ncbi:MAG: protein kinase domain-containing protein [Planctomycetota bacterium]
MTNDHPTPADEPRPAPASGGADSGGGAPRSAERSRLLDLVAQALERLEQQGPAAVEALCLEHPDLAADLRERIGILRGTGMVEERIPERLGEFRLLRRLGSGGMGVVYLAEQERPRRSVALKLVRPEQLYFPGARERFEREIEAVARLKHPGIVPIYTHGEADGLPYFAMELVAGASLEDLVQDLHTLAPDTLTGADLRRVIEAHAQQRATGEAAERLCDGTWEQGCLRLTRQVAEALQHAHEQGVLHRDIKPSNVMVTAEGRALLLDFGLASAQGSERLTVTGTRLGSLAYMSPEQLRGDGTELDVRTDVYSLGVTLYELLTLRAPYGSPTLEQTRQRVLAGEPVAPRALNPALSRDVETVVLKAMEPERARRYPSAAAFADDLARALERRPVSARRAGVFLRARRWAQRRPALATALVAGVLLLVGGPLLFGLQQRRTNVRIEAERDLARAAESVAAEQRDRAQANLLQAREAVDTMLTEVAQEDLLAVPQLEPVRRRLLESALAFYESLAAQNPDESDLPEATARAALRVAFLNVELGRQDEALAALERAEELAQRQLAEAPQDITWTALLADSLALRATTLYHAGRFEEAWPHSEAALLLRQAQHDAQPDELSVFEGLDESLGLRASLMLFLPQGQQDVAALEQAHRDHVSSNERWAERAQATPGAESALCRLVIARNNYGNLLLDAGRWEEALAVLEPAGADALRLDVPAMRELFTAQGIATTLSNLGRVRWQLGQREAALDAMRQAAQLMESVHARSPAFPELKRLLCIAWSNLGVTLAAESEHWEEADAAHARAAVVARELRELEPEPEGAWSTLAGTLINHASLLRNLSRGAEAVTLLEEAAALARARRAARPEESAVLGMLSGALQHLAHARRAEGDFAGCVAAAEEYAAAFAGQPKPLRIAAGYVASCANRAEDAAQAAAWRLLALDLLHAAVAAGWQGAATLREAKDLEVLHAEPAFIALVEQLSQAEQAEQAGTP